MRVPISWLREFAPVPAQESGRDIATRLIDAGLEVETVDVVGAGADGPIVVGHVESIEELTEFKKPIRFCRVAVGAANGHPDSPGRRDMICGAANFAVGDEVVVALPGTTLPGGFRIASRQTYGHVSDGMICSERELGVGDGYDGIIVLAPGSGAPGDDATTLLGVGEEVLDIAVTPDRGYALSVRGVAREAAIAYGVAFVDPGTELVDLPLAADDEPHPCASEDLSACDLFTLRTVSAVNPHAPVPVWMWRRLHAAGMRSVSLAVDITNYVMLETGQPLHAFDKSLLRGPVRARRAAPGETLETLDHVRRVLDPTDLVIADDRGAVGLAGVMGGLSTEISDESSEIALEAAHFAPGVIAAMSRRHKVSSEACRRFERGVDRDLPAYASARAVDLLLRLGGGSYVGMTAVEAGHQPVRIDITADLPARVAGLSIPSQTTVEHLRAVGCEIVPADGRLIVTPPTWRPDLTDPNDLAEEVLRLVGYDRIPSVLPAVPPQHGWSDERRLRRRAGLALAGAGYIEAPAYPFIGDADLDGLQLPSSDRRRSVVRLANPISSEQPFMRTTLLPGLLATARRNIGRGQESVALFENGAVVLGMPDALSGVVPRPEVSARPTASELVELDLLLPHQPRQFAVVLCGDREPAGWWGASRPAVWADAVEAATRVGRAADVEITARQGQDPVFHPGRCAQLVIATSAGAASVIGHAGELHPRVIEAFGLPLRTVAMELNFDAVVLAAPGVVAAPVMSTMPAAKEDVALVVDEAVPAAQLAAALRSGGGELVESVRLFDEYQGDQVEPGRKSLAFSLRFRAPDHTLSAEEVAGSRRAAIAAAAALGAELRT